MRGAFITLEGGEGVGKSTQIATAVEALETAGLSVVRTREPGGTPLAEQIRGLLIGECDEQMDADTELLLMFAARNQHLARMIRPALQHGDWVVCDRFTDATYAYQGAGRGIDTARIRELEAFVQRGMQPDLTLLLDAPVEVGMMRAARRNSAGDRFEREARAFFERVREGYLARAEADPRRFRIIDAAQTLDNVSTQLREVLADFIDGWRAAE
ncbi:MAG: dTMP kinase [Acidihalobacter sp.]|jgi:dTMP kinase